MPIFWVWKWKIFILKLYFSSDDHTSSFGLKMVRSKISGISYIWKWDFTWFYPLTRTPHVGKHWRGVQYMNWGACTRKWSQIEILRGIFGFFWGEMENQVCQTGPLNDSLLNYRVSSVCVPRRWSLPRWIPPVLLGFIVVPGKTSITSAIAYLRYKHLWFSLKLF